MFKEVGTECGGKKKKLQNSCEFLGSTTFDQNPFGRLTFVWQAFSQQTFG
jgi:hypothetical protein